MNVYLWIEETTAMLVPASIMKVSSDLKSRVSSLPDGAGDVSVGKNYSDSVSTFDSLKDDFNSGGNNNNTMLIIIVVVVVVLVAGGAAAFFFLRKK